MSNNALSNMLRQWVRTTERAEARRPRNRAQLRLEEVEDRSVPSSIPVVTVEDTRPILPPTGVPATSQTGFNPQAAADPTNPNKIVLVSTVGDATNAAPIAIRGQFTLDGGLTWTSFVAGANMTDPLPPPVTTTPNFYLQASSPSVAFDRNGDFHVAFLLHNAAKTSGAVVVRNFSFTGNSPTLLNPADPNVVLYKWVNQDPALNPRIFVDNNLPSYTDPETGQATRDTMSGKAVYVVWNTNATISTPIQNSNPANWNPNAVLLAASSNRGQTFSSPIVVNNNQYFQPLPNGTAVQNMTAVHPQIVFSPGDLNTTTPAAFGGQMSVIWTNTAGVVRRDTTSPDGGVITNAAVSVVSLTNPAVQGIPDATVPPPLPPGVPAPPVPPPDIAGVLTTSFQVTPDAGFDTLTDLDIELAVTHANIGELSVTITSPNGRTVALWGANVTGSGTARLPAANFVASSANVGYIPYTPTPPNPAFGRAGATFNEEAPRSFVDANNVNTYSAQFRPTGDFLGGVVGGVTTAQFPLPTHGSFASAFYGLSAAEVTGTWTLRIADNRASGTTPPPTQFLEGWTLKLTSRLPQLLGTDATTAPPTRGADAIGTARRETTMPSTADIGGPDRPAVSPNIGIGTGVSLAYDTSLGSFSPFSGRLYMAYTNAIRDAAGVLIDSDVYVVHSDNNGATWTGPTDVFGLLAPVNDDSPADNKTEGRRWQFMPTVTVDPVTGTVVVTWYDARNDAADVRVATYIATSTDGGQTFSTRYDNPDAAYDVNVPSNQTFLNTPKQALDAITNQLVTLEPVPGNIAKGHAAFGFGEAQSLIAYGGQVHPFWTGNAVYTEVADGSFNNTNGNIPAVPPPPTADTPITRVYTNTVRFATGPRVLTSDMGPVVAGAQAGAVTYNNTFAPDGTRRLDGFSITFDRGVDPATFTPTDVQVFFRAAGTQLGVAPTLIPVASVTRIDGTANLATRYFVRFASPQTAVGTYSYRVGPNITDRIRTGSTAFQSTDTPVNIPDPGTATSVLTVPTLAGNPTVGTVKVGVNIQHTFVGDLKLSLIGPDGTTVVLSTQNGGGGANYTGTVFDDTAVTPITAGVAPFSGSFRPEQPLAAFAGKAISGAWRLRVEDLVAVDTGAIISWSLTFTDSNGNQVTAQNLGNPMDQDADGRGGETANDVYAVPVSATGTPLALPYIQTSRPLIIPGPNVVDTSAPGQTSTEDNLFLNSTSSSLDVTFDRDINGATFTPANIIRMTGPAGPITGPFTITQLTPRTYRIGFPPQVISGGYAIEIGPDAAGNYIKSQNVPQLVTTASGGTNELLVTFETIPASFTLADVLRVNGPAGVPIGPTSIIAVPGNARQFRLVFPDQNPGTPANDPLPAGQYVVDFSTALKVDNTAALIDTNLNAGVDLLFGGNVNINNPPASTVSTRSYATPTGPGTGVPIVANGRTTLTLNVTDDFVITQTALQRIQALINITFPYDPDLEIDLVAPDGTKVRLFTGSGRQGLPNQADFRNTRFDDGATTPISAVLPPYNPGTGGAFNPQFPLSNFIGLSAKGTWRIEINNNGSRTGTFNNWGLTLPIAVSGTGLGEVVADRISVGFRIFTQDPSDLLTQKIWTPVGPASSNSTANSSRMTGIAVDPSDPSGNTVFAAGASGGVWKTTNFMTADPQGPHWSPLTDFGPTFSINVGSIAVFGRNNDPNQSIVLVSTGEGDTSSTGVGFLVSKDGGKTWGLYDSTNNVDQAGNLLPVASSDRDHRFVGTTSFKVLIDPTPTPAGELIFYGALSGGAAGGVWRSVDTGKTWVQVRAGNATDIVLAAGSAGTNGNLERLYAGFRGEGVYYTPQATSATGAGAMELLAGGNGNGNFVGADFPTPFPLVPITNPSDTPNGAKGRITLATPALTNEPLKNTFYQGWLYALVAGTNDRTDGLYMTKDFGRNWTKVRLPSYPLNPAIAFTGYGTNDTTRADHDVFGGGQFAQGNYDQSIAIDPNNPNIVYLGGTNDGTNQPLGGFIRVDVTKLEDTQALIAYSNQVADGGTSQFITNNGSVVIHTQGPLHDGPAGTYGLYADQFRNSVVSTNVGIINLFRHPNDPFAANATLLIKNVASFTNRGFGATFQEFSAEVDTDVHRILTTVDPLTGLTRLIVLDDQGIATVVDNGDGTISPGIGFAPVPGSNHADTTIRLLDGVRQATRAARNGDLQINQFYYGAVQPSQLAADIAGALFYGHAQDNGFPVSSPTILQDGGNRVTNGTVDRGLNWNGPLGDGTGVAVDATGSGTSYGYQWACCGTGTSNDFFRVILPGSDTYASGNRGVGRTNGLLRGGDNPGTGAGQWPFLGGANFAVNPYDKNGIIMSAPANNGGVGRLFRTTNQGVSWDIIGQPGTPAAPGQSGAFLDGTYAQAVAYGAPDPLAPGLVNNFIYAGTNGGRIFVTRTGTAPWLNISAAASGAGALDNSAVQAIVPNPRPGTTDVYAVTLRGVYYKANAFDTTTGWVNITGNLFALNKAIYGRVADKDLTLNYLTALAADWRYAVPNTPGDPTTTTFPVLYVGGEGGIFRSLDQGATWNYFPAASTYTDDQGNTFNIPDGGYLPNAHITDLDLALGDIDPSSGLPKQTTGFNMLVATTYGRGMFAIRLGDILPQFNTQFQPGPRVTQILNPTPTGPATNALRVQFNTAVDATTFDATDIVFRDPSGNPIPVLSVNMVSVPGPTGANPRNLFEFTFPSQTAVGLYFLQVGPDITDIGGNRMNQNGNTTNGEKPGDEFSSSVFLNGTASGNLQITGLANPVTAGNSTTFTVTARDQLGNVDTGFNGLVNLSSSDITAVFPANPQLVNGVGTFTVTFRTTGVQSVNVTFSTGGINPGSASTNVLAAAGTRFDVTGLPASTTAGVATSVTVTVRDQFGNVATGYTGTVHFATSDGQATIPPNSTLTNGVGTFPVTFRTAGAQSVTATDTVTPTLIGSQNTTVNPAAASTIRIVLSPNAPYTVGQVVNGTITALDPFGNIATQTNGSVVVSVSDPAAVVVPNPPTFTNGLGTFQITFNTAATHTLTLAIGAATGTVTGITVSPIPVPPPPPPPTAKLSRVTAVGSGVDGSAEVNVYNPDGTLNFSFVPYPAGFNGQVDPFSTGFTGGNRVAVGDVTGDGVPDIIVGSGPTISSSVKVISGANQQEVFSFTPFEAAFKGGIYVSVGDITGDNIAEIVITPDLSGGPRVIVLRGATFGKIADFFGIEDSNFRGGARAAVGDINGDGFGDLMVAAGFGGGPRVATFSGEPLRNGTVRRLFNDFFLFEQALRDGAFITSGDLNGDGFSDIIGGGGPSGGPRVFALSGKDLIAGAAGNAQVLANFFAGDPNNRGGVQVAAKNIDGDNFSDLVTGDGVGAGSRVTAYKGSSLAAGGFTKIYSFDAFPGLMNGVFVG